MIQERKPHHEVLDHQGLRTQQFGMVDSTVLANVVSRGRRREPSELESRTEGRARCGGMLRETRLRSQRKTRLTYDNRVEHMELKDSMRKESRPAEAYLEFGYENLFRGRDYINELSLSSNGRSEDGEVLC